MLNQFDKRRFPSSFGTEVRTQRAWQQAQAVNQRKFSSRIRVPMFKLANRAGADTTQDFAVSPSILEQAWYTKLAPDR